MPLLAGLLISLVGQLGLFFAKWFSKKVALGMAAVGAFGAATLALYAGLALLFNALSWSLPSWPGIEIAFWTAVPQSVPIAISACKSADLAIAAYKWHVENIKIMAYIT